jgi:hypothetical protein
MTDPGGSFGVRGAGLGLGGIAQRAVPRDERPLCVLLLPERLERFELRERAEDLLTGPGVVAIDPPRLPVGRLPLAVADGLAAGQARRLRLPGSPRALVLFHPLQYVLARALLARHPDAELWYAREALPERAPARLRDLDEMAAARADLRFGAAQERSENRALWERIERLGVPSGRLGSERPDIAGDPRR